MPITIKELQKHLDYIGSQEDFDFIVQDILMFIKYCTDKYNMCPEHILEKFPFIKESKSYDYEKIINYFRYKILSDEFIELANIHKRFSNHVIYSFSDENLMDITDKFKSIQYLFNKKYWNRYLSIRNKKFDTEKEHLKKSNIIYLETDKSIIKLKKFNKYVPVHLRNALKRMKLKIAKYYYYIDNEYNDNLEIFLVSEIKGNEILIHNFHIDNEHIYECADKERLNYILKKEYDELNSKLKILKNKLNCLNK